MKMGIMHHNQAAIDHITQRSLGIQPKTKTKWSRAQQRRVDVAIWPKKIPEFKKDLVLEVKKQYTTSKLQKSATRKLGRPAKVNSQNIEEESSSSEEEYAQPDEGDELLERNQQSEPEIAESDDDEQFPEPPSMARYVEPPSPKPVMRVMRRHMRKLLDDLGPAAEDFEYYDKLSGDQIIPALLDS